MSNKLIEQINELEDLIIAEVNQKEEEIYMARLIINEHNINFKKMDKVIFDRQQEYLKTFEENKRLIIENNKLNNDIYNTQFNLKIIISMFLFINTVYLLNIVSL